MANEQAVQDEIQTLKQELARVKARSKRFITFKVSAKGALTIYGIQRMPVTLYPDHWKLIFDMQDEIKDFIKQNRDKFSVKP